MSNTPDIDFRFLAEQSLDTILRVSVEHDVLYASPACERLLGYTPEEMTHLRPPRDLIYPADLSILIKVMDENKRTGNTETVNAMRWRRKDGSLVWVETSGRSIVDPVTKSDLEYILVLRDITQRKALEEELAALSFTDALTGLANRRAFDEALSRAWQRTLQDGTPTSLLLIDLDHFKQLNDLYGHQVGDDCLRAAARAISTVIRRDSDVLARYGGEELAAILPKLTYEEALFVAGNACRAVEALAIPHAGNSHGRLTISIGVATALPLHGGTMSMPESLLIAADSALYKAKAEGRNRSVGSLLLAKSSQRQE